MYQKTKTTTTTESVSNMKHFSSQGFIPDSIQSIYHHNRRQYYDDDDEDDKESFTKYY